MSTNNNNNNNNLSIINAEEGTIKVETTKKASTGKQMPIGTISYKVNSDDTLERIALKWNTIPSEILHLNRLSSRMLFPGQILYVPDPNYVPPPPPPPSPKTELTLNVEKNEQNRKYNTSPKPGHITRRNTVSDENKDKKTNKSKSPVRHTLSEDQAKILDEECMQRFLKINSKIISYNKGVVDGVLLVTPSALMFDPKIESTNSFEISDTADDSEKTNSRRSSMSDYDSIIIPIEIISNVILYEDLSLKDVKNYFSKKREEQKSNEESVKLSEEKDQIESKPTRVSFSDDIDEIFIENSSNKLPESNSKCDSSNLKDITITTNEALRRHSINNIPNTFDDNLLCYLCIKVNKHKDFFSCPMDRKMKNRLQSEFWFQVPDNSYKITDKICAFFLAWKFDPTYALSSETSVSHFQLVKEDSNKNINEVLTTENSTKTRILNKTDTFIKDWEVVNLQELQLKLKVEKEEKDLSMPFLIGKSKILSDEQLKILNSNLISRAISYNWILTFNTEINGFSLNTLYRTMIEIESPCLIAVRDTSDNVFGAMTSCQLYQCEHFYGTGESFLYTFNPDFRIFKWTGENNFFIKGSTESLGIGCGDGMYGLWFDGDLYHGHSQKCKTYDNDVLSSTEDFVIAAIEIWTFVD